MALHEPYTFEQLDTVWKTFTQQRDRANERVILERTFELKDNTIQLELDNDIQISLLDEFRVELLGFLRQSLRNTNLQIATTVAVQEQKKMIYTQQEKFNYLAEKNPSLFELRKVLGLELDY